MAAPVCSICIHPKQAEVDNELMLGGKLIPTAARYGFSKTALHRHKQECLKPKIDAIAMVTQNGKEVKRAKAIVAGATPTIEDVLSLSALCERLGRSLDRLESGAIQAAGNEQHASHAALAGQLHRGIETTAKLKGYYSDATQVAEKSGFSVNIIIPQLPGPAPASRVIDGASKVIDVTPSSEPIDATPQVTTRRAKASVFGFGDDDDD
jgi:hypothetical protein